jgi:quinoprotein glucose dehydrogenase
MRFADGIGLAAALGLVATAGVQASVPDGDWWTLNRDLASTRYSPLDQINRSNVSQIALAWSYPLKTFNTASPLVVNGIMYFPAGSRFVALDADSGKELWGYDEPPVPGARGGGGFSTRGAGYWPGDAKTPARILVMLGTRMLALDAASGTAVKSFGQDGYIDVGIGYGGTPTISGNVAVIGAATLENPVGDPGNPRAFDVRTGKKLWEFQTVPQAGQKYNDTWGDGWEGRSGTNMWAFSAPVDEKNQLVFLPISSPSPN